MKYAPSIAFEEMSGSAKGVTAAKAKGRKYLRNRGYGKKTTTASQSTVKGIFKQLSQSWKNLTVAQIKAWNNLAQSQAGRSILGSSAKISGLNLYQRLNFWIIRCGGNAVANPPALVGVDAPAAATVQLTDQAFNFTLLSIPENVANLRLVIEASAPTSHGISNAFDKASAFADPFSVVADPIRTAKKSRQMAALFCGAYIAPFFSSLRERAHYHSLGGPLGPLSPSGFAPIRLHIRMCLRRKRCPLSAHLLKNPPTFYLHFFERTVTQS